MRRLMATVCALTLASAPVAAAECRGQPVGKINGKAVSQADGAVFFVSPKLEVDADGAPNSYLGNGKGLSYTCDGVTALGSTPDTDPLHWQAKCDAGWAEAQSTGDYSKLNIFGFATDSHNRPLVQQAGDPLPGTAFITTTSVSIPDAPGGTQRRYVDATAIPYVVLPGNFVTKFKVGPGDVAIVYRPSTGAIAYGVYGDGGKLGEASVRLHQDLGNNPLVSKGGVSRAKRNLPETTLTVVFPGTGTHPTMATNSWLATIASEGKAALSSWGGPTRLKACAIQ